MEITWRWHILRLMDMSILFRYFRLRQQTLVVEQHCAYSDIDALDLVSHHLLGWLDQELVACLRLVPPALHFAEPSISRFATARSVQALDLQHPLLTKGIRGARVLYPGLNCRISTPLSHIALYASHGFVQASPPYEHSGIVQIDMTLLSARMPAPSRSRRSNSQD